MVISRKRSAVAATRRPNAVRFGVTVYRAVDYSIVCKNSSRFSARTSIRMMTRITQIVSATNLPTTGIKQKVGIYIDNVGLDEWERSVKGGETIRLTSKFGGTSMD